jgi:transposase
MLALTSHMRVFVAIDAIDFRSGMNRLGQIARERFSQDPMSGVIFVFRNNRRTDLKILVYDGSGFFLGHKRLSSGKLGFWPKRADEQQGGGVTIDPHELLIMLRGGDPRGVISDPWRRIDNFGQAEHREHPNR